MPIKVFQKSRSTWTDNSYYLYVQWVAELPLGNCFHFDGTLKHPGMYVFVTTLPYRIFLFFYRL